MCLDVANRCGFKTTCRAKEMCMTADANIAKPFRVEYETRTGRYVK
jgi:hypothetical protein